MRSLFLSLSAACLLTALSAITLADDNKTEGGVISGVLIDQACGSKMMSKADPEKAAADHPKSCATKEACEKSGYALITGNRMLKFDDNGNKLAKEFLAKTDQDKNLRVKVDGVEKGDQLRVSAIRADHAQK